MLKCRFEAAVKTAANGSEGVFEDRGFVYLLIADQWFMNSKGNFAGGVACEDLNGNTGWITCSSPMSKDDLKPLKSLIFSNA